MTSVRRHITALVGIAFAVLAMLMVSTVSFASPVLAVSGAEASSAMSADCSDMSMAAGGAGHQKGAPVCAKDCAIICHALITPPVGVSKVTGFEPVSYRIGQSRLTSVTVEKDDPPPR